VANRSPDCGTGQAAPKGLPAPECPLELIVSARVTVEARYTLGGGEAAGSYRRTHKEPDPWGSGRFHLGEIMIDRRMFLIGSGIALSAAGANDRLSVAVVGLRGRGRSHMDSYIKSPNTRVAALCDIDGAVLERATASVTQKQGEQPRTYTDFRKLLENKDIDAISIATPNHWHALMTVWACQHGKDVYVEKPASHNIWEGRKMVEAARKYKRMVQCGQQSRSSSHKREAIRLLREGAIGKLYMARGLCFKRRKSIGPGQPGDVPAGVEYDLWLGPAASRGFDENRFHYNWHWFWDTGNGDLGNQGVHQMDIARWGLGKNTLPAKVHSAGGVYGYDTQETPNTQTVELQYDDCLLTFEVRGLVTGTEADIQGTDNFIGNIFLGTEGYMSLDDSGFRVYLGEKRELKHSMERGSGEGTLEHVENFVKAVRSRNHEDLNCDILEGHLSAALCHMANISYRTDRKLTFDPKTETFGSDKEANKYLKREYREPFVIPDKV
jgi:predicted dehydrogenase